MFVQKWWIYHQFEGPHIPVSQSDKSIHSHEHVDVAEFSKAIGIFGTVLSIQIQQAQLNQGITELSIQACNIQEATR